MTKVGILLTNTGSPAAPTAAAVRTYLAEFLSDRRVINLPGWVWLPILHAVILNIRPRRSARLYQNIWTEAGSPLLLILKQQAAGLQERLSARSHTPIQVALGMRYGQPAIAQGLQALRQSGARRILVFPLFPQYSATTTAAAFDAVFDELKRWRWTPELRTWTDYHADPGYLDALANSVRSHWRLHGVPERVLFSFHGIPLRYAQAGDPYEEQCRWTAQSVADRLELGADAWQVAFQSRFGPVAWLQPYTDEVLEAWGQAGLRCVDVLCPGFSADCLETLDEIGREARSVFFEAGGGELRYIPALNARPDHLDALADMVLGALAGWITADHGLPEAQAAAPLR